MVRYSISIQPPLSPTVLAVAHCHRAVFLMFEILIMAKLKKAEEACCRQQDQMLFSGVTPAPMCKF
jgi:hypothetical protein